MPTNDPVTATINEPVIKLNPPVFDDLPPLTDFPEVGSMDDIQLLAKNTFEMSGLDHQEWGMIEPGKAPATFHEAQDEVSAFDVREIPHATGFQDHPVSNGGSPHQVAISAPEIEAMVRAEVARIFDEMRDQLSVRMEHEFKDFSQSTIPDMAERIIKEEIHKLLSTPPL